jgi:uncharacterized protein (UPF0303 family)
MGLAEDATCVAMQERELRLPRFDEQAAWELGTRLRAMAVERGLGIVIDVRRFGQPLFYAALEGTTPDNPEWVRRKSNVVARYHRSSYGMGLNLKMRGQTLEERGHSIADFAAHGGSFPIYVEGAGIVGCVTVSGLPQRDDHELVVEALCGLLGKDYAAVKLGPEGS